jgi:hypothetical protein
VRAGGGSGGYLQDRSYFRLEVGTAIRFTPALIATTRLSCSKKAIQKLRPFASHAVYSADMGDLDLCDQCGDSVRAESKFAGMCPGCCHDYYSADHR